MDGKKDISQFQVEHFYVCWFQTEKYDDWLGSDYDLSVLAYKIKCLVGLKIKNWMFGRSQTIKLDFLVG